MSHKSTQISKFLTAHHDITEPIDPSKVTLPVPFVICIIGASSGIGEHVAYAYARAKATGIMLSSRKADELARVAANVKKIDGSIQVEIVACDITSAKSVEGLAERVKTVFGRLDVVIPNSGYAGPVTLKVTEGEPSWFQQNFDVNTVGTYHVARYFVPILLGSENGANAFLCVGSFAAGILNGPIANTGYCLSKFAQSRFIEYLGEQFGKEGLLAVNIHPGAVMTPMAKGNTPEVFLPYLIDSVDMCGGFCVWVSKQAKDLHWLTGRFVSALWDTEELVAKKGVIIDEDLLKWRITLT
ncbi:hypothetical protein B0O99DRAFT_504865 [Bisporella sp. PMI_857]|nr:hypothetical protein B0O99DRAFT_504865 [Bisporella sp. PMI_857]